jgi:NADH dehydrogenase
VVVLGGGFAGVGCVKDLARAGVRVTLVDRHTYHQFQPLLYQVAAGALSADDVSTPLRSLAQHEPEVDVKMGEVVSIDPATATVHMADGTTHTGDHLVVALGATPNFFNVPGAAEHSLPLYSVQDAVALRSRVFEVFEGADARPERIDHGALDFVIVGGGPTGVEVAGALAGLIQRVLPDRFRDLDVNRARIHLVDHSPVLLRGFSDRAHDYAARVLEHLGVDLRLNSSVDEITADGVVLGDGSTIASRCVIWAGGLKASDVVATSGLPLVRGGRVAVREDLTVEGHPNVHVVGDLAATPGPDGELLPQLGSVALQSGRAVARNIVAAIDGAPVEAFRYHDKGIMAMIGRKAAVAEMGAHRHELEGPVAFAAWIGVHAWLMSGVRQRVDAFISWGWDWFSDSRVALAFDDTDGPRLEWGDGEAGRPDPPTPEAGGTAP